MFGPASTLAASDLPRECTFAPERWRALARHWHPAAAAGELGERPLGCTVLDQRVVLWRTRAAVSAAQDICIHRGAQLSPGSVQGDELVCPYHGFRYAASGACTLAPCTGSPGTALPSKLHLRMVAAAESGGLVWVRLAPGGEPAPPDLGAPADAAGPVAAQLWETSAQRATEGLIDFGALSAEAPEGRWLAHTSGPFAGTLSRDWTRDAVGFAVQPVSRSRCRVRLVGAGAGELGGALEALRPIIESQPVEGGAEPEPLLAFDRAVGAYRESLAALGLA